MNMEEARSFHYSSTGGFYWGYPEAEDIDRVKEATVVHLKVLMQRTSPM